MKIPALSTLRITSVVASIVVMLVAASPAAAQPDASSLPPTTVPRAQRATAPGLAGMAPTSVIDARELPGSTTSAPLQLRAPQAPNSVLTVLYSQLDSQDPNSATSQNFESGFDAFDSVAADDFVVPVSQTWHVTTVVVPGTYGSTGVPASIHVTFYPDAGGVPGAVPACDFPGETNFVDDPPGTFTVTLSGAGCTLSAGTYWVAVQVDMDFGCCGQWYWFDRTVQSNGRAVWQNPGNGFNTGCTTWGSRQVCLNAGGPDQVFELQETAACPPIALTPPAGPLPSGNVGASYSQAFTASGGTAPYTYAVTGVPPPGLTIDPPTGVFSGVPNNVGSFTFNVKATDAAGCLGARSYSILVYGAPATIRSPILLQESQTNTVNTTSVAAIRVLNAWAPLVPSAAADFPADLALLPSDTHHVYQLAIDGATSRYDVLGVNTPLAFLPGLPGGQTWTDMTTDSTTGTVYASATDCSAMSSLYSVDLVAGTSVLKGVITNSNCLIGLASTSTGQLYGYDILNDSLLSIDKNTGGGTIKGPLGFDAAFGQSMDCEPATGICYLFAFNGTANRAELRRVNLATGATTFAGQIGANTPSGLVQAAGAVFGKICAQIILSPGSPLPAGTAGVPYSQAISASGAANPYTFIVSLGALPPGLVLDAPTGLVHGTPTGSGPYNFTVKATDSQGCSDSQEYTVTIAASPREASPLKNMTATKGVGTSVDVTYTPACEASDHVIYWGTSPIAGVLSWTNAACALGITGNASFDPGIPPAGATFYFVIAGQNGVREGAYGQATGGAEEPEAVGVGACDLPRVVAGSCP